MLAEEKGYLLLSDSSVIGLATGKKMEEIDEFLKWCFDLGLFKKDSKRFWSERILQHRDFREERSRSGKRGAEAKHHSSAISSAKVEPLAVKESKGKDSKEKTYTVRSETESLYSSIEEMCSQYSLDFSVNKKSLDILVERYLGKIHMKVEVQHCISWLVGKNLRSITTTRIGNWFKKSQEIQKRDQLKQLEWKEAQVNPSMMSKLKSEKREEEIDTSASHFLDSQ